jgi:hypothetical protein
MKELRTWHTATNFAERIENINRRPAAADIALQMRPAGDDAVDLEARFTLREGEGAGQAAEAFVIIYENQLRSEIRAGENRGANLQHDRVVRFWSTALPLNKADGTALWRQTLKIPADWQLKQLGVAAFVQDAQAVYGEHNGSSSITEMAGRLDPPSPCRSASGPSWARRPRWQPAAETKAEWADLLPAASLSRPLSRRTPNAPAAAH